MFAFLFTRIAEPWVNASSIDSALTLMIRHWDALRPPRRRVDMYRHAVYLEAEVIQESGGELGDFDSAST